MNLEQRLPMGDVLVVGGAEHVVVCVPQRALGRDEDVYNSWRKRLFVNFGHSFGIAI